MYYLQLPKVIRNNMAAWTASSRSTKSMEVSRSTRKLTTAKPKPLHMPTLVHVAPTAQEMALHVAHNPPPPLHTTAHPAGKANFHQYHVTVHHIHPATPHEMAKLGLLAHPPSKFRQNRHGSPARAVPSPNKNLPPTTTERINGTLMNSARGALHCSGLPKTQREDASRDAAVKYKNILSHDTNALPYATWTNASPESHNSSCSGC